MRGVSLQRPWMLRLAWLLWLGPGAMWVGLGSAALRALAANSRGYKETGWLWLEVLWMPVRA